MTVKAGKSAPRHLVNCSRREQASPHRSMKPSIQSFMNPTSRCILEAFSPLSPTCIQGGRSLPRAMVARVSQGSQPMLPRMASEDQCHSWLVNVWRAIIAAWCACNLSTGHTRPSSGVFALTQAVHITCIRRCTPQYNNAALASPPGTCGQTRRCGALPWLRGS